MAAGVRRLCVAVACAALLLGLSGHAMRTSLSDELASFNSEDLGGKPKGKKKKDKPQEVAPTKKRKLTAFPPVSLEDLSAHDQDIEVVKAMAEAYLATEVFSAAGQCCCPSDRDPLARAEKCKTMYANEHGKGWLTPVFCPTGWMLYDDINGTGADEYPRSCRSRDLHEVLVNLLPDDQRFHELKQITKTSFPDGLIQENILVDARMCCCNPHSKVCESFTSLELEDGKCPESMGYVHFSPPTKVPMGFGGLVFSAPVPASCKQENIETDDQHMKVAPRNFVVTVFAASAALFQTRFALDPSASDILHADLDVVRTRLHDVKDLVEQTMEEVRQAFHVRQTAVRDRGVWLGAQFLYTLVLGAFARAERLLTRLDEDVADGELELSMSESESELLRQVVSADLLGANKAAIEELLCAKLLKANDFLRDAVLSLSRGQRYAWQEPDCDLPMIKAGLRAWGVWWQPKISLADVAPDSQSPKALWARQWSEMRAALDFTPWPLDVTQSEMVGPIICESDYDNDEGKVRYPKLWGFGGQPIMHTFMVFAGGPRNGRPARPGCLDLLVKMANSFSSLSPRGRNRAALTEYNETRVRAEKLGCQGMVPLGRVWATARHALEVELHKEHFWEFNVSFLSEKAVNKTKIVKLSPTSEDKKNKHRGSLARSRGVQTAILDWVSHAIAKYATRSPGEWAQRVEQSLRKTPPPVSAQELSEVFWEALYEQGVSSPYDDVHCPEEAEGGDGSVSKSCGETWKKENIDYWENARLAGPALEAVISGVHKAHAALQAGDLGLLTQITASYGATGFDAPGTVDNSRWDCQKTTETCNVHPRCARAAAQMISHPFMQKKYSASNYEKLGTFLRSTFLNGTFDSDGFHSYCHDIQPGYCWSYTDCLKAMMNWLCSQEETAGHCCPNTAVATACREDVNSAACSVCVPTTDPNASAPVLEADHDSAETLMWLHPGATEAQAVKCAPCVAISGIHVDPHPLWANVAIVSECEEDNQNECARLCGYDTIPDEFDYCKDWKNRCADLGCQM